MSEVESHALELLKRMRTDFAEMRHEQLSQGVRLASIEQHLAANQVEIARLSGDMAQVKSDIALIKRHLDLVEA